MIHNNLVTVSEYARLCGVNYSSIIDRIRRGTLDAVEVTGPDGAVQGRFVDVAQNPPERRKAHNPGKKREAGPAPEADPAGAASLWIESPLINNAEVARRIGISPALLKFKINRTNGNRFTESDLAALETIRRGLAGLLEAVPLPPATPLTPPP